MTEAHVLRGIERPAVEDWMLANAPEAVAPFRWELIAAGGSNLTYRVQDARGVLRVLRRPPAGSALATAHDMSREARVMRALGSRDTGVPVPRVIADCQDSALTGAPFYLMEFVEGVILRDGAGAAALDARAAREVTESLVATQAALHTLDPAAIGLADLGRHGAYVARQLSRWRKQVESAAVRELPLLGRIHETLAARVPEEAAPPALVHGDYRLDNVVLGPEHRLRAVLDWELCTIGDPIADFYWSLLYWAEPGEELTVLPDPPTRQPQFPLRAELEALYADLTGFRLDAREFYLAFSWWKQACIVEGVYARLLRGAGGGMRGASPERAAALVERYLAKAAALAL
jgi:aminoglycoside phosphotransferase (APT) family kinase protein